MDKKKTKNKALANALDFAGETHTGLIREANEDCFCYVNYEGEQNAMAVVADGIGGHQHGALASSLCCRQFVESWKKMNIGKLESLDEIEDFLRKEINSINKNIFAQNKRKNVASSMGTTVVVAILTPEHIIVGHAGDSRLYVLREKQLIQLTEDHSLVAALIKKGVITEEEAKRHPCSHIISRSLGPSPSVKAILSVHPRAKNERYMLCSDGLTTHVIDRRIKEILEKNKKAKNAVNILMKEALVKGGEDNISVICIFS